MFENSKIAVATALNLPKDVVLGEVLISFVGRHCVVIENYRKILIYTDTLVKLQAKNCKVVINGKRLMIEYYTDDEMKITGLLQSVEFEGL
ncbi:sporulation protein [Clostridium sp. MCC353]|uniref:YabP/YqfC family sporulation protein n=1 Tax=Clostridium sp. MCC353 TaxID=2592646 RepID=UPI001C009EB0|nr:YabP/YqfC family sporulation protein [Clostridium sp. MCC353]MBT9779599.1 sporulation protein [Clostridium sp. MCC353]